MLVICEIFNSFLSKRKNMVLGLNTLTAHIYIYMYYIFIYMVAGAFIKGSLPIFPAINTFLYTLAFFPVCVALGGVRIVNYLQS